MNKSLIRQRIEKENSQQIRDQRIDGFIGYVIHYHPIALTCHCHEHQGTQLKKNERHTVDVEILRGKGKEILKRVPCFVYSYGFLDKGFEAGDRVFIQYVNGDPNFPVVTAYYRDPGFWEIATNTLRGGFTKLIDEWMGG